MKSRSDLILVVLLANFSTKFSTVESRLDEPLYNDVLCITNDFLCPSQSKIYG